MRAFSGRARPSLIPRGVAAGRMFVTLALVVVLARTGHADIAPRGGGARPAAVACDAAEVDGLRAHLAGEADAADTWNVAWRIAFTGAAVGTLAVGLWDPLPEYELRHGLYASSAKSAVGALARWVFPLTIRVPEATGDACVDLARLREEVRRVARKERNLFWMGHLGSIAVNLAGAGYVSYRDGTGKAVLSIAVGYPVGLLSTYTMPRGTWKLARAKERAWAVTGVTASRHEDGWTLAVGGWF